MKTNTYKELNQLDDMSIINAFEQLYIDKIPNRRKARKYFIIILNKEFPIKLLIEVALLSNPIYNNKGQRITAVYSSRESMTGRFIRERIEPIKKKIIASIKNNNIKKTAKNINKGKIQNQKRLFRLTWNTNSWEFPSGHRWDVANQGNSKIAYENQYGFGHEEWLLNQRYQLDGCQYGYIRGVEWLKTEVEMIDEATLFTISPQGDRFIIGKIKNIEVIYGSEIKQGIPKNIYSRYFSEMIEELKLVKADYHHLKMGKVYKPTVKFNITDSIIYEKPLYAPELSGLRWNRYIPYKIEGDLEKALNKQTFSKGFLFKIGKAASKNFFSKTTKYRKGVYYRLHSQIVKDICNYLRPAFTVTKKNLSVERSTFGNNIADIVLKHDVNDITILEVKTSRSNVRNNIREGLGQLIDYALWDEKVNVRKIVIVAPTDLNQEEINYLKRIRKNIKLKVEYWFWKSDAKSIKEKVIIY